MKKLSAVLLIAVLAAGFAFAALTGSANVDFGVDLDGNSWGFVNTKGIEGSLTFKVDTNSLGSVGEGDIYAEIVGTYTIGLKIAPTGVNTGATTTTATLKITDANVHIGEDLVIGILNAGGGYSYATAYYTNDDGDYLFDGGVELPSSSNGLKVSYKDYTFGFDIGRAGGVGTPTRIFAQAQTPSMDLAEGVTAQAAVAGKYTVNSTTPVVTKAIDAGIAAKASYASDALSIDAAGQARIQGDLELNPKFKDMLTFEGLLTVAYDPITLNVFAFRGVDPDDATAVYAKKLDAKIAGTVDIFTVAVESRNILDAAKRYISLSASADMDPITPSLAVKYTFNDKILVVTPKVVYTAEKYSATAKVAVSLDFDAAKLIAGIAPTLTLKSTKIVDNATLKLEWAGADFITKKNGKITASCLIEF